jgi:hypothetical protein
MRSAYDYLIKSIRDVKPSMAYDGRDYEKWSINARLKLAELLGMDKFTKVAPKTEIEYEKKIEGATEI